jgi:hypothetical protein
MKEINSKPTFRPSGFSDDHQSLAYSQFANINDFDNMGRTLLHYAARAQDIIKTKLFLDLGANVNSVDNFSQSPLGFALSTGGKSTLDIVKFLLVNGADPNLAEDGVLTPLHLAIRAGLNDCALELLKFGANVNANNPSGLGSPLSHAIEKDACCKSENVTMVRMLLDFGADPNLLDILLPIQKLDFAENLT